MPNPPEMPTENWYNEPAEGLPEKGLYATDPEVGIEPPPEKSFWAILPRATIFPLVGRGKYILLIGAVFFAVSGILMRLSFFLGAIADMCLMGYIGAYLFKIIASTAGGDDQPPNWPDVTDWWDDILCPLWLVFVTATVCIAPAVVYSLANVDYEKLVPAESFSPIIFEGLRAVGLFYMPMGLLAVSLYDSISGLNPIVIIPSIVKVLPAYLVACALIAAALLLPQELIKHVNIHILGKVLQEVISLYFLMVAMYILGIIYRSYEKRLNWFPTE